VSGPIDIAPLKQTVTQTVELGYKGLVANRLIVAIDGYWTQKKNFVGPLLIGSPFAYLQEQGLSQDVGVALGTLFASTSDQTIQALLGQLNGQGIPPAQAAAILAGLVGNAMNDLPAAVVQPDQQVLATNDPTAVGGFLTYRSFGDLSFYGIDAASQLIVTSRLNLFGNVSWVSDNSFDYQELGEDNPDLHLSLNAPSMKWRAGFDYAVPKSFSFNAAGRYTGDFDVQTGPYSGHVDSYFLLDLGAGYDFARFAPGLRMDVSVYNVLDDEHREFVGAPKIGRLALLRLTYSM
ncbi:MAG TPA: TonB-dependent receptor, partial [Rhodothermales bacterium]|nr:TonB-dependent receptor [Rhodothermales bacterium]